MGRPRCPLEEKMAIRVAPIPPPPVVHTAPQLRAKKRELVRALQDSARLTTPVVVATDGGVQGNKPEGKRGTWGVAVRRPGQKSVVVSGSVGSVDVSSARAEREAIMRLLEAAAEAQVEVTVFIDNLGVQQGLRDCIRGVTRRRAWAFADWRQIQEWV